MSACCSGQSSGLQIELDLQLPALSSDQSHMLAPVPAALSRARPEPVPKIRPGADLLGVFKPNKSAPIHRWVSFTEGFSAQLVAGELSDARRSRHVYDPFGGTETTPIVAAQLGHRSVWSEVNPYLREVAETKMMAAGSDARARGWTFTPTDSLPS
jgi:hypothetical protein